MAIGKNKKKFRQKKKVTDPFRRKQWYVIKAPGMFMESTVGRTPVNKTAGTKLSRDALMGRVFKVSLGDLNNDEDMSYRNIHLIVEDVQGEEVLTNFHGMSFASHKLKSLVRKWRTLIEAFVDVNTTDGYKVRLFVIGFTRRRPNQEKTTSYATTAQIKQIRKKKSLKLLKENLVIVILKDYLENLSWKLFLQELKLKLKEYIHCITFIFIN